MLSIPEIGQGVAETGTLLLQEKTKDNWENVVNVYSQGRSMTAGY